MIYMITVKIAESSIFIFLKIFVWHSSGENIRMKVIKRVDINLIFPFPYYLTL